MLFLQLFAGVLQHVSGLHGKAAQKLSFPAVTAQKGQDIVGPLQLEGEIGSVPRLFDLVPCHLSGAVVGHGGGFDDDVLLGGAAGDRFKHLPGGDDVHHVYIRGLFAVGGTGDQGDLGPAGGGGLCDGVAHLAGGVVGEVAHRVQGLLGGTGGDQHPQAFHVLFVGQGVEDTFQQILRLGHLALAHRAAGQMAAGRLHDLPAVAAEGGQVILGHRVFIHLGVHGGGGDFGAVAGQNGGG